MIEGIDELSQAIFHFYIGRLPEDDGDGGGSYRIRVVSKAESS